MIRQKLGLLAALAVLALIGVGCSGGSADNGKTGAGSAREKGVKFAGCMRDEGVSAFPDPDASGDLTIDAVANGSSLDTDSPTFMKAIVTCKDLQPAGFMGEKRSAERQKTALKFAQCMRDNGVRDFPDPTPNGPLIDTTRIPSAAGRGALSIPGFTAATRTCMAGRSRELGLKGQ